MATLAPSFLIMDLLYSCLQNCLIKFKFRPGTNTDYRVICHLGSEKSTYNLVAKIDFKWRKWFLNVFYVVFLLENY